VAPLADPVVVADPVDVPNCGAGEGDDDTEDVGALRGADPTALPLLFI
jgi:hypothetical protein